MIYVIDLEWNLLFLRIWMCNSRKIFNQNYTINTRKKIAQKMVQFFEKMFLCFLYSSYMLLHVSQNYNNDVCGLDWQFFLVAYSFLLMRRERKYVHLRRNKRMFDFSSFDVLTTFKAKHFQTRLSKDIFSRAKKSLLLIYSFVDFVLWSFIRSFIENQKCVCWSESK